MRTKDKFELNPNDTMFKEIRGKKSAMKIRQAAMSPKQTSASLLSPKPSNKLKSLVSTAITPNKNFKRFVFSESPSLKKKARVKLFENKVKKAVQLISYLKECNVNNDIDFNCFKSVLKNHNSHRRQMIIKKNEDDTLDESDSHLDVSRNMSFHSASKSTRSLKKFAKVAQPVSDNDMICNCGSNKDANIV